MVDLLFQTTQTAAYLSGTAYPPVPMAPLLTCWVGQADMMSCGSNCGNPSAPDLLCLPVDVWPDGTRLVVLDGIPWGRVLIWNKFPSWNQQPADLVMTGAITADGNALVFGGAGNLASNGTQLFVATDLGNRVLIWNTFPPATFYLTWCWARRA